MLRGTVKSIRRKQVIRQQNFLRAQLETQQRSNNQQKREETQSSLMKETSNAVITVVQGRSVKHSFSDSIWLNLLYNTEYLTLGIGKRSNKHLYCSQLWTAFAWNLLHMIIVQICITLQFKVFETPARNYIFHSVRSHSVLHGYLPPFLAHHYVTCAIYLLLYVSVYVLIIQNVVTLLEELWT